MDSHDKQILSKILSHTDAIIEYCIHCSDSSEFLKDKMLVEACVFNLMQIGEIAKTELSEETKSQISTIPWIQLYGLRNRIVHGYSGIDMRIVWDTIHDDIPKLRKQLKFYLNNSEVQ